MKIHVLKTILPNSFSNPDISSVDKTNKCMKYSCVCGIYSGEQGKKHKEILSFSTPKKIIAKHKYINTSCYLSTTHGIMLIEIGWQTIARE